MKKGRRKKGSGTLYRNKGSAVWVAQWEMNGKRFRKSTGTSVHKEAVKLLAEFVAPFASRKEEETVKALSARVEGLHKQAGHLAFEEAWTVFAGRKADRTIGSERDEALYAGRWRKLAEWMKENHPEKASLDQLDEETAKEFLSAVFDTSTAKTYNEFRGLFAQVWEVLKKPAGLDSNPWKAIPKKPVKKDTIPQRKLTDEELQALIRHLETECAPELRLFFLLGIYTGQRSNDCALLEWEDVDLPANRIRCKPHKTAQYDVKVRIPIHERLARELELTPPDKRTGYVLPTIADAFSTRQSTVSRWIRETFEGAGIETYAKTSRNGRKVKVVGFHSLRHSFVSICALAGVPLSIVREIVGHTNQRMTEEYAQVEDAQLDRVLPALPDFDKDSAKGRRQKALKAFETACKGLLEAGLTSEDWRVVGALLAQTDKQRKALPAARAPRRLPAASR